MFGHWGQVFHLLMSAHSHHLFLHGIEANLLIVKIPITQNVSFIIFFFFFKKNVVLSYQWLLNCQLPAREVTDCVQEGYHVNGHQILLSLTTIPSSTKSDLWNGVLSWNKLQVLI